VTTEERQATRSSGELVGPVPDHFPERDVRRKRPPVFSFLLRMETFRRLARVVSLLIIDLIGVLGALFTALLVKLLLQGNPDISVAWHDTRQWGLFAYLVTVLMFARVDLYGDRAHRPGMAQIATSLFQAAVISLVFALASGQHFSSYYIFYGSLIFGTVYISTLRALQLRATAAVLERAGYRRRAVLVGAGHHAEAVAQALAGRAGTKVEIVGHMTLTPMPSNGLRALGTVDRLNEVLTQERIQEVILADPDFPQDKSVELVDVCHQRGVTVHVAPTTMEILMERAEFVPGQSVPLFMLRPPVFDGFDFALKRGFDLIIATLSMLVLSPLLALTALLVKLSSPGPVIYRSMRPGIGGRPFACLKFRTMRHEAEDAQDELESLNEKTGALFKIRDDPRLTPVGRILRRFSLDELPQLVNVVRGEMSLVGPRPLPMRDFERLEEWHKKRYLVLPGITGLWQVSGRAELDFDDLVRLDFLYLERWSILLDLTILMRTIPAVLTRRGAF
jgi:exopolysaccharide biosynthesis polyprenyl glycosylphosphotransferase